APALGGAGVGAGYRPGTFPGGGEEGVVAEETIRDVDASGHWPGKVVTRVSKAGRFWEEPPGKQDYLRRFPVGCPAPFPRQGEPATASLTPRKGRGGPPRAPPSPGPPPWRATPQGTLTACGCARAERTKMTPTQKKLT